MLHGGQASGEQRVRVGHLECGRVLRPVGDRRAVRDDPARSGDHLHLEACVVERERREVVLERHLALREPQHLEVLGGLERAVAVIGGHAHGHGVARGLHEPEVEAKLGVSRRHGLVHPEHLGLLAQADGERGGHAREVLPHGVPFPGARGLGVDAGGDDKLGRALDPQRAEPLDVEQRLDDVLDHLGVAGRHRDIDRGRGGVGGPALQERDRRGGGVGPGVVDPHRGVPVGREDPRLAPCHRQKDIAAGDRRGHGSDGEQHHATDREHAERACGHRSSFGTTRAPGVAPTVTAVARRPVGGVACRSLMESLAGRYGGRAGQVLTEVLRRSDGGLRLPGGRHGILRRVASLAATTRGTGVD